MCGQTRPNFAVSPAAIAVLPASERLRHLGECHIRKPHWHSQLAIQLSGKPHVLVSELQGKAWRGVLVGEKSVIKSVERALASPSVPHRRH
jgi:hypothetical protein